MGPPPGTPSVGGLLAGPRHDFVHGVGWRQRLSGGRLLLEFPNHRSKGPDLLSEGGDSVALARWRGMNRWEGLRLLCPHLLFPRQAGGCSLSAGYHHLFFGVGRSEKLACRRRLFAYAPCCSGRHTFPPLPGAPICCRQITQGIRVNLGGPSGDASSRTEACKGSPGPVIPARTLRRPS